VAELLPLVDNFELARTQVKVESEGENKINSSYQVRACECVCKCVCLCHPLCLCHCLCNCLLLRPCQCLCVKKLDAQQHSL